MLNLETYSAKNMRYLAAYNIVLGQTLDRDCRFTVVGIYFYLQRLFHDK